MQWAAVALVGMVLTSIVWALYVGRRIQSFKNEAKRARDVANQRKKVSEAISEATDAMAEVDEITRKIHRSDGVGGLLELYHEILGVPSNPSSRSVKKP